MLKHNWISLFVILKPRIFMYFLYLSNFSCKLRTVVPVFVSLELYFMKYLNPGYINHCQFQKRKCCCFSQADSFSACRTIFIFQSPLDFLVFVFILAFTPGFVWTKFTPLNENWLFTNAIYSQIEILGRLIVIQETLVTFYTYQSWSGRKQQLCLTLECRKCNRHFCAYLNPNNLIWTFYW